MNWLNRIFEFISSWIPKIVLIEPDEEGLRISLGCHVRSLLPGWYVFLPLLQTCAKITVSTQIKDIREQSLTTKDGKNVIVGGAVQYRITDVRKALLNVMDFDSALQTLVLGTISTHVSNRDYDECRNIPDLENVLLKGTREVASGFGLKVARVFITDFCKADTYRIVGMGKNETIL